MIDNLNNQLLWKFGWQAWAGGDYENWVAHLKIGGGVGKLINLEGHQWSK